MPCLSDVFLDAGASRKKGALQASSTMGGPDMLTEDSESSGAAASGIVDLQEMITTLVLTFSAFFFFFFFLLNNKAVCFVNYSQCTILS